MGEITVEKKLELIQQVRTRQYRDQSDMLNRERILYGKPLSDRTEIYNADNSISDGTEGVFKDNTVKLRYAIAGVLFLIIILLDKTGHSFAGVPMDKVFTVLEQNYDDYSSVVEFFKSSASK